MVFVVSIGFSYVSLIFSMFLQASLCIFCDSFFCLSVLLFFCLKICPSVCENVWLFHFF